VSSPPSGFGRTVRTKGSLSHKTARLMVFKLVMSAAKTWRRLKGENQLPRVIAGVKFTGGVADSIHRRCRRLDDARPSRRLIDLVTRFRP